MSQTTQSFDAVLDVAFIVSISNGNFNCECYCIKALYAAGYTAKQIVEAGFNKSTVYRQYKKQGTK